MEHLDIQTAAVQQRRRGITMVQAEFPVIGLDIPLPDLFAGHGEAGELAVAGHDPDILAIRDRRR